jgi:glycosyltransferase involved in cell wall biosynthesis
MSHDTERAGAQRCLLELAHVLKKDFGRQVELATAGDGELWPEFERIAPMVRLHRDGPGIRTAANVLVSEFKNRRPEGLIVVNTAAIADIYRALEDQGVRDALAWIHELPASIDQSYGGGDTMALIDRVVQRIVVPCEHARDAILSRYGLPASKIVALPNGIAQSIVRGAQEVDRVHARRRLRALIGASPDTLVVLGCGIPEGRKGVDLFGLVAAEVCSRAAALPVRFVWLGKEIEPDFRLRALDAMDAKGCAGQLHFVGSSGAPELVYAGVDLVLITSRVDASPLVSAEAMTFGLPVIFFEGSGGVREQLPPQLGLGVPGFDTHAMAERVLVLLHDAGQRHQIGRVLSAHARRSFSWKQIADLLDRAA